MKKSLHFLNRPISPHLFIYDPQISSLGSIWHRMSSVILILMVLLLTLTIETMLSTYTFCIISFIINKIQLNNWFYLFYYKLVLLFFMYHAINGFRYMIYDLNLLSNASKFTFSFSIVILLVFLILIINI